MKRTLKALKEFRYGTRRLQAGDYFEASGGNARVLIAMRRAEAAPGDRMPGNVPPMPAGLKAAVEKRAPAPVAPAAAEPAGIPAAPSAAPAAPADPFDHDGDGCPGGSAAPADSDELRDLRARYAEVLGKRPFPGWDAATLREKIEAAAAE